MPIPLIWIAGLAGAAAVGYAAKKLSENKPSPSKIKDNRASQHAQDKARRIEEMHKQLEEKCDQAVALNDRIKQTQQELEQLKQLKEEII